jgi:cytochrome c peroxidase
MKKLLAIGAIVLVVVAINACRKDPVRPDYMTSPFDIPTPIFFTPVPIPADNPLTEEGIKLGRHLFYEELLSGDNTQSCGSCHRQEHAFSDTAKGSVGIHGDIGDRQAMPLFNIAWADEFFWDGRAATLEEQIFGPVVNPIEMDESWVNAVNELKQVPAYVQMFDQAFGVIDFDSTHVSKAIAQFIRTMVSSNSRFDKYLRFEDTLSIQELQGWDLFRDLQGADCFHCHAHSSSQFTDFSLRNNGLDSIITDPGWGDITGFSYDIGKFKVPSLRNIEVSGPYMHDGRFQTLDEVINFYSEGIRSTSPNIDPSIEFASQGGVQLNPTEKAAVKAWLLSLTDWEFLTDPAFSDPGPPQL